MKLKKLQFVVEDGVGIITMNYMKNLNAIDDQMADELMYVVDTCENDPNVKVVVLKGMPKAFSAGGDIADYTPEEVRTVLLPKPDPTRWRSEYGFSDQ